MTRIIITVVFLIAIAVLIILNIGSDAPVNVFGWKVEEMPVSVVAIVSFVAGVVYSFIFYLVSYIERGRRERLDRKRQRLKSQEAQLKTREQEMGALENETKKQAESARRARQAPGETGAAPAPPAGAGRPAGLLGGLFGRKKT